MRVDLFLSLPAPTALLVLSSLLDWARAEIPSQPIKTLGYRVLNVVPYQPQPTPPPPTYVFQNRALRHRRQSNTTNANTICGYIGGDPKLPATCSLGSHCVLDTEHKVMGCCPDGVAQCTTGVFTGCVDFRNGPLTVVNPYVYTCSKGDLCYQNAFENGFSQYGCGSKTDMGTTVVAAATGVGSAPSSESKPPGPAASQGNGRLDIPSIQVSFTAKATTVATPITISTSRSLSFSTSSTGSSASPSGSSSTESPTGSSSSSSAATTSSPSPTTSSSSSSTTGASPGTSPSSTDASTAQTNKPDQTGVIVGSTISGVAGLVAIVAAAIFLLQRRNRNKRTGPGLNGDSTYISPMTHGPAFKPISSDQHGDNQLHSGGYVYPGQHPALYGAGASGTHGPTMSGGAGSSFPTTAVAGGAAAGAAGAGAAYYAYGYTDDHYDGAVGAPRIGETEHLPLTAGAPATLGGMQGELDDFSTGFHRALSRIGEEETDDEDRTDLASARPDVGVRTMAGHGLNGTTANLGDMVSPLENESTPIWQQQRRLSSNTNVWL